MLHPLCRGGVSHRATTTVTFDLVRPWYVRVGILVNGRTLLLTSKPHYDINRRIHIIQRTIDIIIMITRFNLHVSYLVRS